MHRRGQEHGDRRRGERRSRAHGRDRIFRGLRRAEQQIELASVLPERSARNVGRGRDPGEAWDKAADAKVLIHVEEHGRIAGCPRLETEDGHVRIRIETQHGRDDGLGFAPSGGGISRNGHRLDGGDIGEDGDGRLEAAALVEEAEPIDRHTLERHGTCRAEILGRIDIDEGGIA